MREVEIRKRKMKIKNLNTYPNSMLTVYSRNGQPVFQSAGYPHPWNGTYNGKQLPAGTYYYVIDFKNEIIVNTKNTKNSIFAIPAAVPAIPPKPKTAAINAMTKNVIE